MIGSFGCSFCQIFRYLSIHGTPSVYFGFGAIKHFHYILLDADGAVANVRITDQKQLILSA